jgi:hypothetical protein
VSACATVEFANCDVHCGRCTLTGTSIEVDYCETARFQHLAPYLVRTAHRTVPYAQCDEFIRGSYLLHRTPLHEPASAVQLQAVSCQAVSVGSLPRNEVEQGDVHRRNA